MPYNTGCGVEKSMDPSLLTRAWTPSVLILRVLCNKRCCTELEISDSDTDKVDSFFYRWFVIQSVNQEHPLSKLSPFLIDKAIKTAIGTVKEIKCPIRFYLPSLYCLPESHSQ